MHTTTASVARSDERGIFDIQLLGGAAADKEILCKWLKELASLGPESLFQSSEYFDFLLATELPGDLSVALVTAANSQQVCGIIPIRRSPHQLKLSIGKYVFGAVTFNAVQILGSLPNMPALPQLFDELAQLLMRTHPGADALCLEAVPVQSWLWSHVSTSKTIRQSFNVYVPHGPRQWHSVVLPPSFRQYQERFSAKHRYNLTRQVRRLRVHGDGLLNLRHVTLAEQVEELVADMRALATQQQLSEILRADQYIALAQRGLLSSFVLVCGDLPCAIAFATRYASVLQVHTLFYDHSVWPLSPGTTLQHMLVQELIETGGVSRIEFGYGPGTTSTGSEKDATAKGQVLLLRKNPRNIAKKILHGSFCDVVIRAKGLRWRFINARRHVLDLFAAPPVDDGR